MQRVKNFLFWKIHGDKLNKTIESKCQLVVNEIPYLEKLSFVFHGREFNFTKTGENIPTNQ